jgi:hypothetical protein
MSEYPAITRIRPISASSAGLERKSPEASSVHHVPAESGVSAVVALGSLIVGLRITGVPPRRT